MSEIAQSERMREYFAYIDKELTRCYDVAGKARDKGLDPETRVDIPVAKNMAERVIGLVSTAAEQLSGAGEKIVARVQELEAEYGQLDWRVGFKISEEVAKEIFCKFGSKKEAMEVAIRVGFAYLTLGIVSAPLEGFIGLDIKRRNDGKGEYFCVNYAGPVRGAGGTASAVSVVLADYVRVQLGYAEYDPTEKEVLRYITEIIDYHERVTNLQYFPSEEELKFFCSNLPIEISGDPTEKFEVSNHKDLPRVETNRIRGGICLVIAEGLCQKSPKIWKRLAKWGDDFSLSHWAFMEEFLALQKTIKAKKKSDSKKGEEKLTPNYTFIKDMVAGRPVLTHPMRNGGFRLRYGRGRTSGFSATCTHPASMAVLESFIAVGTQMKIERPGKATSVTVCEALDGPIVRLENGDVVAPKSSAEVKPIRHDIVEILYIGDLLTSYGDFSENNHKLVPAGYCEEWWVQELNVLIEEKGGVEAVSGELGINALQLQQYLDDYFVTKPSFEDAFTLSKKLNVAMHPQHIYFYTSITKEQFQLLLEWAGSADIQKEGIYCKKIVFPFTEQFANHKRALELLGIVHSVVNNEYVVVEKDYAKGLGLIIGDNIQVAQSVLRESGEKSILKVINEIAPVIIKDKAGTFLGSRMGRPEKAKMRKLTGSPHVLFPVGEEGDRLRAFNAASDNGKVTANFPTRSCLKCNESTVYPRCERCGSESTQLFYCTICGTHEKECPHGGALHQYTEVDINHYLNTAKKTLGMHVIPKLVKGVRGTSNKDHVVEHLAKGLLRAKYGIHVNKDGTTRYDMTELPITHFTPAEVGTSVEKLRSIGYDLDIHGKELVDGEQVLELKPQDVILPSNQNAFDESANEILIRVAKFCDELLEKFYGLEKYYNVKTAEDLVGHLVIGLAPHISAGLIGRIVGFSQTQGCYAHPLWHAGLRRDCDGDECAIMLLLDSLLNFSRQYLPNTRGAKTMDSPLVLTAKLDPAEVDDQVHGLDTLWQYPLELYYGGLEYKPTNEVKVEQIKHRLGKPEQFEGMGYTHPITNINNGILYSAYKSLPSMMEKLDGQMRLATKIRAVDTADVSRLVIERHFIKDLKGNLRKFSQQQFRCVKCNSKYRRPPLIGKCTKCGDRVIFTITYGSITKYLEPSLNLARKYDVSPYLLQSIELLRERVESVFGKEKDKQIGLGEFA